MKSILKNLRKKHKNKTETPDDKNLKKRIAEILVELNKVEKEAEPEIQNSALNTCLNQDHENDPTTKSIDDIEEIFRNKVKAILYGLDVRFVT